MQKLLRLLLLINLSFQKDLQPGKHSIRFPDEVLDQRLCLSFVTGFDWIAQQLSTSMDLYLKFYNDPSAFGLKRERSKRRKDFDEGKPSSEVLGGDI